MRNYLEDYLNKGNLFDLLSSYQSYNGLRPVDRSFYIDVPGANKDTLSVVQTGNVVRFEYDHQCSTEKVPDKRIQVVTLASGYVVKSVTVSNGVAVCVVEKKDPGISIPVDGK